MSLSTNNLNKILWNNEVTKDIFNGTYPSCMIPKSNKSVYAFITNTDDHKNPGEHWNSWFVRNKKLIFFDSFGRNPNDSDFPFYYHKLTKTFNQIEYNKTPIQAWDTFTCGHFCIHFIYVLSLGLEIKHFIGDYFKSFYENDIKVIDFINSII